MTGRRKKQTAPASPRGVSSNITTVAPAWLSEHSQSVWRETIETLESEGRPLGQLNLQAFVGFCDAAGLVRECAEVLAKEGMTIDGGREGKKRHPAVTTRISALNSLRGYACELGLTPGTAARIPTTHAPADHAASEAIRRSDPGGYARFVETHGRPPTNPFEVD